MNLKNQKDFFSGLLFVLLGVAFAWDASTFAIGTAQHMGPGYFPLLLGAVLTLLGGLLVFKALVFETEDGGRVGAWAWRPVLCILLASLLLGLLLQGVAAAGLPPMGLVIAVIALTLPVARATSVFRWKEWLLLALLLALVASFFSTLLPGVPLALWPVWAHA